MLKVDLVFGTKVSERKGVEKAMKRKRRTTMLKFLGFSIIFVNYVIIKSTDAKINNSNNNNTTENSTIQQLSFGEN